MEGKGNAGTHRFPAMGVAAGLFSATAVASDAACPAYPWPNDDGGAQRGRKVFMQSDCAACHSMLPYAKAAPTPTEAEAKVAEIVVVNQEQPATATARPLLQSTATYTAPDLAVTTKMVEKLLRRNSNLYAAQELIKKVALPTPVPVWLQLLQPYVRAHPQTA